MKKQSRQVIKEIVKIYLGQIYRILKIITAFIVIFGSLLVGIFGVGAICGFILWEMHDNFWIDISLKQGSTISLFVGIFIGGYPFGYLGYYWITSKMDILAKDNVALTENAICEDDSSLINEE